MTVIDKKVIWLLVPSISIMVKAQRTRYLLLVEFTKASLLFVKNVARTFTFFGSHFWITSVITRILSFFLSQLVKKLCKNKNPFGPYCLFSRTPNCIRTILLLKHFFPALNFAVEIQMKVFLRIVCCWEGDCAEVILSSKLPFFLHPCSWFRNCEELNGF